MKIMGGRGIPFSVRPISLGRLVVLTLALYPFLLDFVTPLTPTPIAIAHGKAVPQPSLVAVVANSPILRFNVAFSAGEELSVVRSTQPADPLNFGCVRRL